MEAGETLYEVAEASATVTADLYTRDRGPTRNSLLVRPDSKPNVVGGCSFATFVAGVEDTARLDE
jgi:hypothetical protein